MADKKTARQTATEIEAEQNFPILNKYNRTAAGAVEKMSPGVAKEIARGAALAGMVPAGLLQIGQSSATGRKGRSQEEMDELTREVGRAQRADKKAKGGEVKKYASGGTTTSKPEPKKDTMPEWAKNERENRRRDELNKREAEGAAKEVKRNMSTFGFKNGGSASSRADGIAQRGKTRGKIV
jgi:hypothetical protein